LNSTLFFYNFFLVFFAAIINLYRIQDQHEPSSTLPTHPLLVLKKILTFRELNPHLCGFQVYYKPKQQHHWGVSVVMAMGYL
jgi:hypothetical protein